MDTAYCKNTSISLELQIDSKTLNYVDNVHLVLHLA